ncbi:MAG: hypothetical protein AAF738_05645 [Bacteroidota bacterium]
MINLEMALVIAHKSHFYFPSMKELPSSGQSNWNYLTEDAVKRATMPFLKSYYRYRSNLMNSELETGNFASAEFDLRTDKGLVIDGLLTYKQRGGSDFVVSFEASAQESKEEVLYKVQDALLFWDGFAISSIVATIVFSVLYVTKNVDIVYWGWGYAIFGLLMSMLLLTLFYMSIFRYILTYFDRYHYIYAVEQFKKYHADEQWIAIGYDIFKKPEELELLDESEDSNKQTDSYLEELKDQCITNGFGLVEIKRNLTPVLIITPAREGLFGNSRSLANYIQLADFSGILKNNRFAKLLKKRFPTPRTLTTTLSRGRYQRKYRLQVAVFGLSCLLMGSLLWRELREPAVLQYEAADLKALQNQKLDVMLPPEIQPTDSIDQLNVQPFREVGASYLNADEAQPVFRLRNKQVPKNLVVTDTNFVPIPIFEVPEERVEKPKVEVGLFIFDRGEIIGEYPCARIAHHKQIKYAVQESIHADKQIALQRVATLGERGISTNMLSLHCFQEMNDSFMVFFELLYDSLNVAQMHLQLSEQSMKRLTEKSPLTIRVLEAD